jgi:8-oxo-dGTP diphosphatase
VLLKCQFYYNNLESDIHDYGYGCYYFSKTIKFSLPDETQRIKHAGKWEFPGGKMEQDENAEQCLSREIKEEFSINITVNEFFAESIHEYEHAKIRLLAYRITWVSGKMALKDHDRIAWVSPDKLLEYDLLPADIPIAQECKKRINSR